MNEDERSLRDDWEFRYRPSEVLAAAQKRLTYHAGRLNWWQKQMSQAEKQLKRKGFEYREERHTMGSNLVIVGDPQLAKRTTDCKRKMKEHRQNVSLFETWVRVLRGKVKREPKNDLALKINDVVFFRL